MKDKQFQKNLDEIVKFSELPAFDKNKVVKRKRSNNETNSVSKNDSK